MKLIADAGSTKTDWALLPSEGEPYVFESAGINALMMSAEELRAAIADALAPLHVPAGEELEVYYYGAGCVGPEVCRKVADALPAGMNAHVSGDLLGAARALYGHESGLAGILGTGSNTGLYDGREITANMPPLGYVLGDEGSGAALGAELLRQAFRHRLLQSELQRQLGMGYPQILLRVNREPGANAFLASLVPFVAEHRYECTPVIDRVFTTFFTRVREYYPAEVRELRLVGGVAAAFADELHDISERHGLEIARILRRPMDGLIEYHKNS